jgi:transcriptional regulator with XRE-family HTH domain
MRYAREGPSLYVGMGEQIMLARRRANLTQRQLGDRLGVSHVAVGNIERGKTKPNLDHLAAVAEALDVPLSRLLAVLE